MAHAVPAFGGGASLAEGDRYGLTEHHQGLCGAIPIRVTMPPRALTALILLFAVISAPLWQ